MSRVRRKCAERNLKTKGTLRQNKVLFVPHGPSQHETLTYTVGLCTYPDRHAHAIAAGALANAPSPNTYRALPAMQIMHAMLYRVPHATC